MVLRHGKILVLTIMPISWQWSHPKESILESILNITYARVYLLR